MNTSALRYTSATPRLSAIDGMARVSAAARVEADRLARLASATRYADTVLARLRAEGAVTVCFKIVRDSGWKERVWYSIDSAEARATIIATAEMEAEVWGTRADGSYSDEVF